MVKIAEKKKKKSIISSSRSDKIFDTVNICIMIPILFIYIWPLWFVLISSISDPNRVWLGEVIFWPVDVTLKGYQELFKYKPIWIGYRNNIIYTVVGTAINMIMTVLCAYPLSRKNWAPRKFFMKFCLITMYVSGGLIPTYMVVRDLHLIDTIWAMIIPSALSFYNALIVRSYFMNSVPDELQEAATLDGANEIQYLCKVLLPLSKPVLAVVCLYYAVGHWNDYYSALIYINSEELIPLQTALRQLLMFASNISSTSNLDAATMALMVERQSLAQSLKYTSIIAGILPMMVVYPFVQKYFVKGVMVGAVKG